MPQRVLLIATLLFCTSQAAALEPATAYDVTIDSPVADNASGAPTTAIAATVFIPAHEFGATYPLILHSHGWGGDRVTEADTNAPFDTSRFYSVAIDSQVGPFWQDGYAVISFDERGFHDSAGAIRVMDPDFEVQDAIAVLDWAEANLDLARDDNDDPLVGAIGGSYGGGFQLLLAAFDSRLDAITPSVTWFDLPDSLAPNDVIQKLWVALLCASAIAAGDRTFSDDLTQACAEAGSDPSTRFTEDVDPAVFEFLGDHGMGAMKTRHDDPQDPFSMRAVDTLLTQGQRDLLFPLNEALNNDRFLSTLGGDVRLITHQHGHILGPPLDGQAPLGAMRCGQLDTLQALHLWFDEKLKGVAGAADAIPRVCISLDDLRGQAFDAVPIADGSHDVAIPATTVFAAQNNYGGADPSFVPLGTTIVGDTSILAGIPLAELSIEPLVPGTDVVAFLGIGVQSAGESAPRVIDDHITPVRDGQVSGAELFGVGEMLRDGDQLGILLYGDVDGFNNAGKTAWQNNSYSIQGSVALPVPEPGSAASLAAGALGLAWIHKRRSRAQGQTTASQLFPPRFRPPATAPSPLL